MRKDDTPSYVTPPNLARRWGVKSDKIIAFIRAGELRAFDISLHPGVGKPRYRIPLDSIVEFESRRSGQNAPVTPRRKRNTHAVIQFF